MSDGESRDALRRRFKAARSAVEGRARVEATHAIATHLLPLLRELDPRTVAGYAALGGEASITDALAACRSDGRITLLPILNGDKLAFAGFDEHTSMAPDRFGIAAPVVATTDRVAPADLDVVLVPLVGFDERLERLGMGGGFYDRSFAHRRDSDPPPLLIGIAFECQRSDDVKPDWWDVSLDAIVTETGVRRR